MDILPTLQKDVYKEAHRQCYHPEVTEVYSNYTNRNGTYAIGNKLGGVVNFGLQYFIKQFLIKEFNEDFFSKPKEEVCKTHKRILSSMMGFDVDVKYLEELHDLGYLPLEIKSLPEGVIVPYGVPSFTVKSTVEGFQWLTNAIETALSADVWPMQTSATTTANFKLNFLRTGAKTGIPESLLGWLIHDFSFRGMFGRQAAAMSGLAHLTSSYGTDTIPAVVMAEQYYGANVEKELVAGSVVATEHSVTCSWQSEGELAFLDYLMKEVAPTGILSVVADTWDFWNLVTNLLPQRKEAILARDGKLVIRPDSGDPVEILCGRSSPILKNVNLSELLYEVEEDGGDVLVEVEGKLYVVDSYNAYNFRLDYNEATVSQTFHGRLSELISNGIIAEASEELQKSLEIPEWEQKGLVECLWDIFGGDVVEVDGIPWKHLNAKIGAIYGDSITLERQKEIIRRLEEKGFAPTVVLGVGSYTYQYVTRDTHGSAVKATSVVKAGKREAIFKDPKTDSKKKSAKGLLQVTQDKDGKIILVDDVTPEVEANDNFLEVVFFNGELVKETNLQEVREIIDSQLKNILSEE